LDPQTHHLASVAADPGIAWAWSSPPQQNAAMAVQCGVRLGCGHSLSPTTRRRAQSAADAEI
jgi:hypothetical protein